MAEIGSDAYNSENGIDNLFFFDIRVYIAGVLIPVNAVYITSAFSNIPTATITLPPDSSLFSLGRQDRVPVHIFIINKFIKDSKDNYQNKALKEGENKYQIGEPLLVFEGETTGFGYLSDGGGRDFVINAQNHFGFLKDIKLDFLLSFEDYCMARIPGESLVSLKKSAKASAFPLSLFTQGFSLGSSASSSDPIKYPTKLIENLFSVIINSDVQKNEKNPEENSLINFYQNYCKEKIKIENRISKIPYFDVDPNDETSTSGGFPLLKLITSDQLMTQFNTFLQAGLPSNGGTLWDIIYSVFSQMEYDLNIPIAPTYNPTTKKLNSIIAKPMLYDGIPPKCNIIYRNQIKSIRVDEVTHSVPTRIRLKDIKKTVISYERNGDSFDLMNRLDYYPSEKYNIPTPPQLNKNHTLFSSELLETEKYTGPFLIDMTAPPWTTFVNTQQFEGDSTGEKDKQYRMTLMKSMLMLSIYQNRQITITLDYNPFVVCGAPAIIFDVIPNGANIEGLTFSGYVLSVYHSITRNSLRTTLTLGYTRIIQEEFSPDTRLYNVYKPLSTETTHDSEKMDTIYTTMYGCQSMPVDTTEQNEMYKSFYDMYYTHATQNDPRASYEFQERRLTTFDNYLAYMKLKVLKEEKNEDGDTICLQFGDADGIEKEKQYIGDRKDNELIAKLMVIQDKILKNKIYNKV